MKKYLYYALLLLGSVALGGCSEQLETDIFDFSKNTVRFTADGGTQTLVIDVKCDCTLSCDADWIDYTPQYVEAGKSKLTIEAAENPSFEPRNAVITLTDEELGIAHTIDIRQEGIAPYIDCEPELEASYRGGTFTIEVRSNVAWEAWSSDDWLTLSPIAGSGTAELTVELPPLSSGQKTRRSKIILANAEYRLTTQIAVVQSDLSLDKYKVISYMTTDRNPVEIHGYFDAGLNKHNYEPSTRTGSLVFDQAVTEIWKTFEGCTNLLRITLPESVQWIGERTFYDCSSLTDLVLPESITYIGVYAFCGCSSLTSLTLPESVQWIGGRAFYCTDLTSLYCRPTVPPSWADSDYGFAIPSSTRIYVPQASVEAYKSDKWWSYYASQITAYNF